MGCLLRCNSCGSLNGRMEPLRWFSSDVESLSPEWRETIVDERVWTQVDPDQEFQGHGEAGGFFVTSGTLDGYAKVSGDIFRAANEKIASDLAYDLRLPVPPVVLIEPQGRKCSVSSIPFRAPWKWGHVKTLPDIAAMTPRVSQISSAMVVFDTWVDNSDRSNDGNVIVSAALPDPPGVAYIDYAYSLAKDWGEQQAPDIAAVRGPFPQVGELDRDLVNEAIGKIADLKDSHIRQVVTRIPDEFLPEARRNVVADGLIARRDRLRPFFDSFLGGQL